MAATLGVNCGTAFVLAEPCASHFTASTARNAVATATPSALRNVRAFIKHLKFHTASVRHPSSPKVQPAQFTSDAERRNVHARHGLDGSTMCRAPKRSRSCDTTKNRAPKHNPRPDRREHFEPPPQTRVQLTVRKQSASRRRPAAAARWKRRNGLRRWRTLPPRRPVQPRESFLLS